MIAAKMARGGQVILLSDRPEQFDQAVNLFKKIGCILTHQSRKYEKKHKN